MVSSSSLLFCQSWDLNEVGRLLRMLSERRYTVARNTLISNQDERYQHEHYQSIGPTIHELYYDCLQHY